MFAAICCNQLKKQNPNPDKDNDKVSSIGKYHNNLFLKILLSARKTQIFSNLLQHFWSKHIDVTL